MPIGQIAISDTGQARLDEKLPETRPGGDFEITQVRLEQNADIGTLYITWDVRADNPGNVQPFCHLDSEGSIAIGDNVLVMNGVRVSSASSITIGDGCMLGNFCYLSDSDWHDIHDRTCMPGGSAPSVLERGAWIGDSAIVLKGVRVGENSIVGAGAVVVRDVPSNVIVAGNPAVIVKERDPGQPGVLRAGQLLLERVDEAAAGPGGAGVCVNPRRVFANGAPAQGLKGGLRVFCCLMFAAHQQLGEPSFLKRQRDPDRAGVGKALRLTMEGAADPGEHGGRQRAGRLVQRHTQRAGEAAAGEGGAASPGGPAACAAVSGAVPASQTVPVRHRRGTTTVHRCIAPHVAALFAAAQAAGLPLGGGGYRDPAGQIRTRRNNCGPSSYDIYEKPSTACRPPTAKPGPSMPERGLAIDFTCGGPTVRLGDQCSRWLLANSKRFGLTNWPQESWHYSSNGH